MFLNLCTKTNNLSANTSGANKLVDHFKNNPKEASIYQ